MVSQQRRSRLFWLHLLRLEKQDSAVAEVKVNKVLRLWIKGPSLAYVTL
jgi:hypothetical protein